MQLYVDLEKARVIDRAKLVKRPVQVRGKNGRIFTRMQWVDPHTGEPVSQDSHTPMEENKQAHAHSQQDDKKFKTQKDFIDHHIKNMSRDEKYHHINKHGIKWDEHKDDRINHMRAINALKEHLYKNPHLVGAGHLPTEDDGTREPDGTESVDDFTDKYKKHPELLYDMMRHLGVLDKDAEDPRNSGAKAGPIKHMHNMMKLKKYLKEHPEQMESMRNHEKYGVVHNGKTSPSVGTTNKPTSKAQKGGNTIKGILDTMSDEDKYALMRRLGIADSDPRLDVTNKSAPIKHMHNMMKLKKAIELDPSILNINPDTGDLSDEEKERISSLKGNGKVKHEIDELLGNASKDLKLQWADSLSDHDLMKNRIKSDHENVDNMHKISALRKILEQDPSIMEKLKPELEREELLNYKIGNKMLGKFLRQVVGLKGNLRVGDVVAGDERGKSWEFGTASFARIEKDDEGEPILSVVDCGEDGDEWNEHVYPMSQVRDFIEGLKKKEQTEPPKPKEVPLQSKPPKEIWKALQDNFKDNYTPEVGNALKRDIGEMWDRQRNNDLSDLVENHTHYVDKSTLAKVLEKLGADVERMSADSDHYMVDYNDKFKSIIWGHKVDPRKSKNAIEYLQNGMGEQNDTWVLHESAKHWSPEERTEARKDFITGRLKVQDEDKFEDSEDRKIKLINHLHKSLEYTPFDLMTDVMANGCTLNFVNKTPNGDGHWGNYYLGEFGKPSGSIHFDHHYFSDDSVFTDHPTKHKPAPATVPGHSDREYVFNSLSDTAAHEFAHAIDNFLAGGDSRYTRWNTKMGRKYAGEHKNVIRDSYRGSVLRSNPDVFMGAKGGLQPYFYHKDEWMSSYEGRIYDPNYYNKNTYKDYIEEPVVNGKRLMKDKQWDNSRIERGIEHWSENVSRYANAVHHYQMWKEETGVDSKGVSLDDWSKQMHDKYLNLGYADDHVASGNPYLSSYNATAGRSQGNYPAEHFGYMYHRMSQVHPEMLAGIKHILDRPDFISDTKTPSRTNLSEQGDYTRKSEMTELLLYLD